MPAKISLENYPTLLQELKLLLTKAKYQAYKAVDNLRVQTYWQVGERIVREELQHKERGDYGKKLVDNLARDLGFSRRVLFEIIQFYRTYPIVQTVSAQLGWSHLTILIGIENKEEREFYEYQVIQNGWSVRVLKQEIQKRLYHRIAKEGQLVVALGDLTKEIFVAEYKTKLPAKEKIKELLQ